MLPLWVQAGLWGLVSGSALVIGAAVGYFTHIRQRIIAAIMAFGSGVLISALAYELIDEAYRQGGFNATALGFVGGGVVYTAANWYLNHRGARHRKRSAPPPTASNESGNGGLAIAFGALLDGIPESIVIGLSLLSGNGVSIVAVVAIFLSNIPESLSSATGMKKAGHGVRYIFGVWGGIALVSGLASLIGLVVFRHFPSEVIAVTTAVAAGGILAMLADTMIPEVFETTHEFTGLITVLGFLASFILTKWEG